MRNVIASSVVFLCFSCAGVLRNSVRNELRARGEVVQEWKEQDQEFLVNKEGNRFVQYRLVGTATAAYAEVMYAIDTLTRTCYTGPLGTTPLGCESLLNVPTMKAYVANEGSSPK